MSVFIVPPVRRSRDVPYNVDGEDAADKSLRERQEHRRDDGGFCGVCGADLAVARRLVSSPHEVSFADRMRAIFSEACERMDADCSDVDGAERFLAALGVTNDERARLVEHWYEWCSTSEYVMCGVPSGAELVGISESGEYLIAAREEVWRFL